jgi:hypothetical protein
MKKLFFFALSALCFLKASASHLEGAELRYEFNGTNYTLYLTTYATCGGIPAPSTETIYAVGPSLTSTALTALLMSRDTSNPLCPSVITKCQSSTSTIPGYVISRYQTNITLPSTGTYTFSYNASARSGASNIATGNMYVECLLNNSTAVNSSAWAPNLSTFAIAAGASTATAIPLQGTDAQGDSLSYTFVQPLGGPSSPITYNTPYSLSSPLGGGGVCSLANQTLYVKGTTVGSYFVSIKMSDYRKGVLVGTTHRDFMIYVLGGSTTYSIPIPSSTTTFLSNTCPGQSNSVTLTFNDPVSTDSVFVDVTPPVMTGWSFTVTPAPGIGSGSSTITWTTPTSMNPATLPNFYFNVIARDNACPAKGLAKFVHMVVTRPCLSDSVWPGDANGDKTVNILDPLAIAVAFAETGAARTSPTTTWTAQACVPWSTNVITNINKKHADCDGDGTVTSSDLTAVGSNWGMSHPKSGGGTRSKTSGAPNLYFDHTGIKFTQGTTVTVPIKFGDATSPVNTIYGIVARVYVDGVTLANAPTFTYTGSWLGTSGTTLNFSKKISNNSVDWAYARTTHTNGNGQGVFAQLVFAIPATATPGTKIILRTANEKMIDKDGNDVANFNVVYDTVTVEAAATGNTGNLTSAVEYAGVVPNPSTDAAQLFISANTASTLNISIADVTGKQVWLQKQDIKEGTQYIDLPYQNIGAGLYIVRLENTITHSVSLIKWAKQ